MAKYGNKKTVVDGITFDSKREAERYKELKLLLRAGVIEGLQLQPEYTLIPAFKKNGTAYREMAYRADFSYLEEGKKIVEDVKGMETQVFKLKRKLFEHFYPDLEIRIVR